MADDLGSRKQTPLVVPPAALLAVPLAIVSAFPHAVLPEHLFRDKYSLRWPIMPL